MGRFSLAIVLGAITATTIGCGTNPSPRTGNGAAPLAILKQPTNLTVVDGQSAEFSVVVQGSPPFRYQWRNGSAPVVGETQPILSIPVAIYSFNKSDAYNVIVTDASGSQATSQSALLTVTPRPPVISESPLSQTVVPGSAATFSVAATGSLPLTYHWNLNGAPLPNATATSYTSGSNLRAQNNNDVYTVTVTNGAGQSLTSNPASLTVGAAAPSIDIDCSEDDSAVAHQVTYRRGVVEGFDLSDTPSAIAGNVASDVQNAGVNFLNATLDAFNQQADAGLFDYNGAGLFADPSGSGSLAQALTMSHNDQASSLPVGVQISGTPFAFPKSGLDPGFEEVCGATGNFYPLPLPGASMLQVQDGIESLISGLSSSAPDAIWIGTQEPSHTLGYPTSFDNGSSCASVPSSQLNDAIANNIQRYISFWTPIAKYLRTNHLLSGGIQLNAGNSALYETAAQQISAAQMPLDFFTIQDYSPSADVTQAMYGAYETFQQNPSYLNVKVMIDRYGIALKGNEYGTATGIIKFLDDETLLMSHADMLYGYAVETTGIRPTATVSPLLPKVIRWLQAAPAPLRPLTSTTSDLHAFALVQKAPTPRAYISIWNVASSPTAYTASVHLRGLGGSFKSSNVRILDGVGNSLSELPPAGISVDGDTIHGLSLKPNELLLMSLE